jgi:acyl-CoA thioesterase FadM
MSWRLKPASFMDMAQEAANLHAATLGFGYDELIASRTAWVLSRMHVVFVDTLKWRDEVTLATWHKGLNR